MLSNIGAPQTGDNISILKPDPKFLIVFRIRFSQVSHHFLVICVKLYMQLPGRQVKSHGRLQRRPKRRKQLYLIVTHRLPNSVLQKFFT